MLFRELAALGRLFGSAAISNYSCGPESGDKFPVSDLASNDITLIGGFVAANFTPALRPGFVLAVYCRKRVGSPVFPPSFSFSKHPICKYGLEGHGSQFE